MSQTPDQTHDVICMVMNDYGNIVIHCTLNSMIRSTCLTMFSLLESQTCIMWKSKVNLKPSHLVEENSTGWIFELHLKLKAGRAISFQVNMFQVTEVLNILSGEQCPEPETKGWMGENG